MDKSLSHTVPTGTPVGSNGQLSRGTRTINVSFAQPLPGGSSQNTAFVKTNTTLIVWLFFLGLGGGLLALYYAHIGYLPDIEWKSALIYLGVASIIGTAVGLLLLLLLLIPGVIWSVFLICDPLLMGLFCFEEHLKGQTRRDPSFGDIFLKLGVPFGLLLAPSHLLLPAGTGWYLLLGGVGLGMCSYWMYLRFREMVDKQRKSSPVTPANDGHAATEHTDQARDDHKRVLRYTFWFGVSLFLSQLSMLITYLLSGSPRNSGFWILTAICAFTVLLSNHIVALLYAHHRREASLAAVVAALLLLIVANRYSSLPAGIMDLYGFGSQPFTMYVNADGVNLLKSMNLANQACPDGVIAENKLCRVEILSEVGSSYYLRRDETSLTLPKQMVIARRTEPKP